MDDEPRRAHAVLDLPSRAKKAEKIARLLSLTPRQQPLQLLEIGTGSGGIAHWFAHHPRLRCEVVAVDVRDNRKLHAGYDFLQVQDVTLPFADASFDVVISNHVIEHVGDATAQSRHLAEFRRVMKPGGIGYLAVPNRWMLIEPHYRLIFLSWWPHRWRTPYLRLWRKGDFYDCEPLEMLQLERMLAGAGLRGRNMCVEGLRTTLEIERPNGLSTWLLAYIPNALLHLFSRINPTLIYTVVHNEQTTNVAR